MTRIRLHEINDKMEETPSKRLLVFNGINKGNTKTRQLLRTFFDKVQTRDKNENNIVEQVLKTFSNNSAGISTATKEEFQ